MFSLGGGWGMDWQGKFTIQNCGRAGIFSLCGGAGDGLAGKGYSSKNCVKALVKPNNQPGGVVLAP